MNEVYKRSHTRQRAALALAIGGFTAAFLYVYSSGAEVLHATLDSASKNVEQLKNADFSNTDGTTLEIGVATTMCLAETGYSTDRVWRQESLADTYNVRINGIGTKALQRAAVEACVLKETGHQVVLVVDAKPTTM